MVGKRGGSARPREDEHQCDNNSTIGGGCTADCQRRAQNHVQSRPTAAAIAVASSRAMTTAAVAGRLALGSRNATSRHASAAIIHSTRCLAYRRTPSTQAVCSAATATAAAASSPRYSGPLYMRRIAASSNPAAAKSTGNGAWSALWRSMCAHA